VTQFSNTIMSRSIQSYITIPFLSILFIACHSKTDPATARTPNTQNFHEVPRKTDTAALSYDTTSQQSRAIINELDSYYRTQVRAGFNGSVLIGYKGKVLYERCFGYSNREKQMPLNENSSSQLASVSKTFTGTAILYLYQRKYLNIDDPVQHYISNFPYPAITLRMLLTHRSGLPDYTRWVPDHIKDTRTPITNDQMLQMLAQYKPALEFKPNTRFTYSNTNYAVLASVIEKVTEMNFRDFMRTYIFEPLGMSHTFIYNPAKGLPAEATISYKYNWIREPDMFADGVYGDKGLYSTPEDIYRFDQSFYQNKLLSNEMIELAYGPCSFERPGIKNYGLGWRMLCYPNGNKIIYHNGWWHGNNTSFYRFIKEDMTIIVLGNRFSNAIYHQAPVVYSIMKGVPVMRGFDTEE
jgi:CubicO group peptidase (beta-lactamase class C family)